MAITIVHLELSRAQINGRLAANKAERDALLAVAKRFGWNSTEGYVAPTVDGQSPGFVDPAA